MGVDKQPYRATLLGDITSNGSSRADAQLKVLLIVCPIVVEAINGQKQCYLKRGGWLKNLYL